MFKKLLVYGLILSTTIVFQSPSWSHGRDRDRHHNSRSSNSDSDGLTVLLVGLSVIVSIGLSKELIDYSFSSSTDVAQVDDFLKNEEAVVVTGIQPTEAGQRWTLARSSDKAPFTIDIASKQGTEQNQQLVEQKLSVDVTPQGTILSKNEDVVLFLASSAGKRELSNM